MPNSHPGFLTHGDLGVFIVDAVDSLVFGMKFEYERAPTPTPMPTPKHPLNAHTESHMHADARARDTQTLILTLAFIPHAHTHSGFLTHGDIGVFIVDAIDSLLVFGMKDEYERARAWIAEELTFDQVCACVWVGVCL